MLAVGVGHCLELVDSYSLVFRPTDPYAPRHLYCRWDHCLVLHGHFLPAARSMLLDQYDTARPRPSMVVPMVPSAVRSPHARDTSGDSGDVKNAEKMGEIENRSSKKSKSSKKSAKMNKSSSQRGRGAEVGTEEPSSSDVVVATTVLGNNGGALPNFYLRGSHHVRKRKAGANGSNRRSLRARSERRGSRRFGSDSDSDSGSDSESGGFPNRGAAGAALSLFHPFEGADHDSQKRGFNGWLARLDKHSSKSRTHGLLGSASSMMSGGGTRDRDQGGSSSDGTDRVGGGGARVRGKAPAVRGNELATTANEDDDDGAADEDAIDQLYRTSYTT